VKVYKTGIYTITPESDGMKVIQGGDRIQRDYPDYLKDESNVTGGRVDSLFFPKSLNHLVKIMMEARDKGKKVTVSGGRTGICAGAVPAEGGYLVSLDKMTRPIGLDYAYGELTLKVESGLRLSELSAGVRSKDLGPGIEFPEELRKGKKQYFYPPDPTETTATIGGTAATNASGARTLFYGPTRDYVVGIDVVLSTGELLRVNRGEVQADGGCFKVLKEKGRPLLIPAPSYDMPSTKHSAGLYSKNSMDLIDLFIGSEGILGVIADVTVKLIEEPGVFFSGAAFFENESDAVDFVVEAKKGGVKPLALEYFDNDALKLLEDTRKNQGPVSEIPPIPDKNAAVYYESAVFKEGKPDVSELKLEFLRWRGLIAACGGDPSIAWAALNKRDSMRLKAFRHALPESVNKLISQNKRNDSRIHKVGTDMAVPDMHLKEIIRYYRSELSKEQLASVIFGHIGNSHLHVNMIPDSYDQLLRAKDLYKKFAEKAVTLNGTISAEHGIGKLKKDYLHILYPSEVLEEMKSIKSALDPDYLLNPGNVL
jgi:D-lactate dehydrogenase (cytochrome)